MLPLRIGGRGLGGLGLLDEAAIERARANNLQHAQANGWRVSERGRRERYPGGESDRQLVLDLALFQADRNMPVTGQLHGNTLAALMTAAAFWIANGRREDDKSAGHMAVIWLALPGVPGVEIPKDDVWQPPERKKEEEKGIHWGWWAGGATLVGTLIALLSSRRGRRR